MPKLLLTLTIIATFIFFPLIANEKTLRCKPIPNQFLPSSYYKMKTSFMMFSSYYLRVEEKWEPFCKDKGSVVSWSSKDLQNLQQPVQRIKGDKAISCVYQHRSTNSNTISYTKIKIDFDLNTSTFCYDNNRNSALREFLGDTYKKDAISFKCHTVNTDLDCELMK